MAIKPVRRIVTGHDETGKAVVLMDSASPNAKLRSATGLTSTLVWATDETPADISSLQDRADRESGVAPPVNGSVLRVVDFPPVDPNAAIDNEAMKKEMGISTPKRHLPPRHPLMHATRTVDYAIIMEGEIDMLLDDTEIHKKAGDVLVQQGTNHAWVNNSKANCRVAFVLIDAEEPAGWKNSPAE